MSVVYLHTGQTPERPILVLLRMGYEHHPAGSTDRIDERLLCDIQRWQLAVARIGQEAVSLRAGYEQHAIDCASLPRRHHIPLLLRVIREQDGVHSGKLRGSGDL